MRTVSMLAAAAFMGAAALAAGQAQAASPAAKVRAWREAHEKEIVTDFAAMLAMPNVATTVSDVEANARYLQGLLQKRGFTTKLLYAEPGTPPSVFGELKTPGARRTVTYYAHYDGQPIGQKGWISTPFQPSMRTALPEATPVDWKAAAKLDPEWRLYARSAGDDKGTIQAFLSAFDALKAAGIKPSVNIKVVWEGEEEQGSPHFAALVAKNLETVRGDLLIMGDGPISQTGQEEINFGNRGIVDFVATVYGPLRPLHDGHYGSWAPSPTVMLAHLIASLRDEDGKILIPGIYDDVAPVSSADRAALAARPDVESLLRKDLALGRNIGGPRLADGYMKPTLNVRAIHAGDTGPQAANAIATEGEASFDIRLVPGETPERVKALLEDYLTKQGWFVTHETPIPAVRAAHPKVIKLTWNPGSVAIETPMDGPAAQAVAGSITRTIGYPVLKLPLMGGSSGIADIVNQMKAPMVGVPIANYDDNQHAQNENLKLKNLWDGIEVYAGLMADLNW